jgi:hypothetical protein
LSPWNIEKELIPMQKDASPVEGPDHVLKDLSSKAQDKWATAQQQRTATPPVEKHARHGAPELAAPAMHGTPVPPFETAPSKDLINEPLLHLQRYVNILSKHTCR